jgi:hydrogenase-4 component B
MSPITIFILSIFVLVVGAVVTMLLGRLRETVGKISLFFISLSAIGIYYVVISVFTSGPITGAQPLWTVPGIAASFIIRIDYLSALFLAIISFVSVLVSLYSVSYMQMPVYQSLSLRAFYPILLVFFAGVMCVVTVADMFFFFIFWEIMTLASYLLVIFNKNDQNRLRAGFKYFFITHVATALLFIATIILYVHGGSFSFAGLGSAMTALQASNPKILHLVLAFFFLGFATKAGILPMGDWLPDAYPAAPAPASAAFAGSMTKLGIYGLVRIFCDILPVSGHTQTWGLIIALFGTGSIFVGTMTALVQEDSKRLLSFHVIGQMGYMFLGIGVGTYFLPTQPVLAIVGIGAGVFHLINHVSYKSCLFFNAGSVYWKVGTRDLNKVGGLSKILPVTAVTTVIASLSIAGIPPFSGFSSKWLIYQASIKGGISSPVLIGLGIIAIFISAVTLASFIKFFSSIFYGKYADNQTNAKKGEVPLSMMIPQLALSFLCIFFGIVPLLPVKLVYTSVTHLFDPGFVPPVTEIYGASGTGGLSLSFGSGIFAGWNPVIIVAVGLVCIFIAWSLYRSGKAPSRVDETWYCGEPQKDEEVRYRAHSFYLPFKQLFSIRIGSYRREGVYPSFSYPKVSFTERHFFKRIINLDKWFFNPLVEKFMKLMRGFSATHSGIPHVYLLWLVIGTLAAVVVLFSLAGVR